MTAKFLTLNDITAYTVSFKLSNEIWEIVLKWSHIAQITVGAQLIRSIDSISANLAEGFGRFHKKDKEKFYYNSRGSVYESLDWIEKSKSRDLITKSQYESIMGILKELPREINYLIKYTEEHLTI